MGRGDHNRSKGTNFLAQTPKHQVSDGIDVEYSEELADHDDVVARERSKAADRRAKQK
ncbi:YfhD family protein [Ornithinibacillus contaminans]|uniref:YfhD family protein n=1 Tax=Ornithinibacillus contaminans TaxID=694055 RepID=UPI0007ECDDE8|nr:YfhD family protein [Ornithinibacillus contaminans]